MQITAAVARGREQPFSIETIELEDPRPDEILVRIVAVGLCHTDIMARDGYMPMPPSAASVLGHEGSGVVERVGAAVTKVKPGDRVALSFLSCGDCSLCRQGKPSYCTTFVPLNFDGRRVDGTATLHCDGHAVAGNFFGQSSFATYALTREANTVVVPDDAPLELVGPLGCGVQTGAGAIINVFACEPGSSLLVLGGGSVGLSAVMAGAALGCSTIIVAEPHQSRRQLALELGATHTIDPIGVDVAEAVRAILPQGVGYAFDTSGREDILEAAVRSLASLGVLGMVAGTGDPDQRLPGLLGAIVNGGLTLKGIVEGSSHPDTFILHLLDLHRQGRFPFDRLIKTFPFARINEAVAAQHAGEAVKIVLLMPDN